MIPAVLAQTSAWGDSTAALSWSQTLVEWSVLFGVAMIALGQLLCVYRLLKGPHLADRVIAVDTFGILLIGLVVLLSIRMATLAFLDAVLVLSLLAFAGTVAMAQYIGRPHLRKRPQGQRPQESQP
jgi:multicomponent Na+:H+ antiporter subunit F